MCRQQQGFEQAELLVLEMMEASMSHRQKKGKEMDSSLETWLCCHLSFRLVNLIFNFQLLEVQESKSVVLCCQVCRIFLQQLQKNNTQFHPSSCIFSSPFYILFGPPKYQFLAFPRLSQSLVSLSQSKQLTNSCLTCDYDGKNLVGDALKDDRKGSSQSLYIVCGMTQTSVASNINILLLYIVDQSQESTNCFTNGSSSAKRKNRKEGLS